MKRRLFSAVAVVALSVTGVVVGTHVASGQSTSEETVFVPIVPCRLVDTRPGDINVGPRATKIAADETAVFNAHDSSDADSSCAVPATATAIATNTVAVAPTARSFLTLFPGDVPNPGTANLNYVAGQPPTPNAANIPLAADGSFNVFNAFGQVHVVIDINGYYQPSTSIGQPGPQGPTGPQGPGAPALADGAACTAGMLDGTIVNGHDGDGNVTVKCFRSLVTTPAGSTAGFADGVGPSAQFNFPRGVAVDAAGNGYVADRNNHRIRKITPAGTVSTLAGSGSLGFADGVGAAAQFNFPRGVAVDAAGNVYVADADNRRIRKISPAGAVSTLAGSGTSGFADGPGATAQFASPTGVAVDAAGNVYVADSHNHRIRKISPAGAVLTLAGSGTFGFADGSGATAQFNFPVGVAVDAAGNVYVGDNGNHRVRKINPAGVVSTLAGSGTPGFADGSGATAQFFSPQGVAVDAAGNVYVADSGNSRVRKITSAGVVSTLAGSGTSGFADGVGAAAQFANPRSVAVDAAGNVYVADNLNHRVRKIN